MAVFSRIAGTGACLPEKVLTRADLETAEPEKMVDISDEWIRERTGVREPAIETARIEARQTHLKQAPRRIDKQLEAFLT